MLSAEVIASGSELTSGDRLNTNAPWLSAALGELGLQTRWHTTVGDLMEDNVGALKIALARADVVIMTGGLGPTQDDLTREVFAQVAQVPLAFRPELMEHIAKVFAIRGIEMPERNRVQAFMPEGSRALTNPLGTAPGIWMTIGGKSVAALPGVPKEMQRMWRDQVMPLLTGKFGSLSPAFKRKINLFGIGESAVEAKILDLTDRAHIPEVGITASEGTISLRIVARTDDRAEGERQLAECGQIIYQRLAEHVFSEGETTLADAVLARCEAENLTLAMEEIGTGGILTQRLLWGCPESSCVNILSSVKTAAFSHSCSQSESNAVQRAEAVAKRENADIALFFTVKSDKASQTGESLETHAAQIAIARGEKSFSHAYRAVGSRHEIVSRSVNIALSCLLKVLSGQSL